MLWLCGHISGTPICQVYFTFFFFLSSLSALSQARNPNDDTLHSPAENWAREQGVKSYVAATKKPFQSFYSYETNDPGTPTLVFNSGPIKATHLRKRSFDFFREKKEKINK